ncbi:MAG: tetratricopeptide repeat protein [Candidatus Celaenobacter polaris]|nr:tetratricopeptide repeat protein [Candidatus Celaenobacter polaris]
MSCILSTIPDKKRRFQIRVKKTSQTEDKVIRYCIVAIWGLLIAFGVISLINPTWLQSISTPGKNVEAQNYKDMGDHCLKNGNYRTAVSAYSQALEIQPTMDGAHLNLAITYSQMKLYDKAIYIFKKLLKQNSEYINVIYYNLGEIYENTGQIDEAIEYYTKSAETAPFTFNSYSKIGKLHIKRKKWDLAIKAFQKTLDNRLNLKICYKGMLKKGLYTYSNYPEITEIINGLLLEADSEELQKHYDSTIFQKILDKDIELAKIYHDIGCAYFMEDDLQNAISHFRMSLKIWPNSEGTKKNLNAALEKQSI